VDSLGREESAASAAARRERNSLKQAWVRAPEISCGEPLRRRLSSEKTEEQDAVRKSSWLSVTDNEEFVGRLSLVSLFPQYLRLSVYEPYHCDKMLLAIQGGVAGRTGQTRTDEILT